MATLKKGNVGVEIFSESEEEEITNKVAQYPVQSGNNITDHTQRESLTWTFEGKIFGKNKAEIDRKYGQLVNWQHDGSLLTYTGAIRRSSMLITNLHRTEDEGGFANAIKFSMELTHVEVVKSSFVKAVNVGPKKPSPPANPGVWVTVRPGNTYWGWMIQYGTSIQQLRNWNHWPDRRIPIGVRARVK